MEERKAMDKLFLKNVKPELHSKKTGQGILFFSDFNIGNNFFRLAKEINNRTIHAARVVIVHGDYLAYDSDIILQPQGREKTIPMNEVAAAELVDKADFYWIGRQALNFNGCDWSTKLNTRNCIFQYWGSHLRGRNKENIRQFHLKCGAKAIGPPDYSCVERGGEMFYHIAKMYDAVGIKAVSQNASPVRVSHCPTNRNSKGTKEILAAFDALKAEGLDFEPVLIENMKNDECMKLRATCQIHVDQISSCGFYGGAAIEAMAMGQLALVSISNMTLGMYPKMPIVRITKETVVDQLRKCLDGTFDRAELGRRGRQFVKDEHSVEKCLREYMVIHELVVNGLHDVIEPEEWRI